MSHTPHELAAEFPEHAAKIHTLKATNTHFARKHDEYHAVNKRLHRAETRVEPLDDLAETELRKRRAMLRDEIVALLAMA